MTTPIIAYIAGPFRAKTAFGIAENVRAAERVGLQVANAGAMPLIPHANTANFSGECTDKFWLDGTMELMRRCDCVVLCPGWQNSSGSIAECAEALRLGIPVHEYGADRSAVDSRGDGYVSAEERLQKFLESAAVVQHLQSTAR